LNGKVAAAILKAEITDRGDPLRPPRDTLYPRKLALTSPTSGGRSVRMFACGLKANEFKETLAVAIKSDRRGVPVPCLYAGASRLVIQ
jgi:hypothetical protein